MEINTIIDEKTCTITLAGRLDTLTAPELQSPLFESVKKNKKTVLNCSDLIYISSAGLRILLMAEKTAKSGKTELVIQDISQDIREIFDMTGFSGILTIE
jgi:anti-anti-sigma factor